MEAMYGHIQIERGIPEVFTRRTASAGSRPP